MDFYCFLIVLATIFLCFSSHNISSKAEATFSDSTNKLLIKVCKESDDYEFCVQVMNSKTKISSAKGIRTVANYALAIARKQSKITRNFFNRAANASKNPEAEKALKECASYFDQTMGMFNLDGLEDGTATLDVHYALDNSQYCENALAEANVNDKLISAAIKKWQNYFSVAYATVVVIEGDTS